MTNRQPSQFSFVAKQQGPRWEFKIARNRKKDMHFGLLQVSKDITTMRTSNGVTDKDPKKWAGHNVFKNIFVTNFATIFCRVQVKWQNKFVAKFATKMAS